MRRIRCLPRRICPRRGKRGKRGMRPINSAHPLIRGELETIFHVHILTLGYPGVQIHIEQSL